MAERLGEIQKQVITVCDREADIWHYLHYKVSRGKPHAECDAKRRAGSPPGPDAHQLQRSQHKKSRQQRPGALAHVCLLRGAGEDGACWYPLTSEKSGECRRCATYRQPLRATLADRGIPQSVEKWWYMCGIAANADPG